MALKLYFRDSNSVYSEVTSGGDFTNPITTTHDGKNGDTKTVCLYLRNDNASLWYSNIEILPVDILGADPYGDVGYEETGWGVKLSSEESELTSAEWNDIDWGTYISMDDVGSSGSGDSTTYTPFWYLISCPPNTDAQNKSDIILRVSYTENAV
jgi:hypothetical protein